MRFGVFLPSGQWPGQSHGEVIDRTIAAARAAEAAGFDDVWLAEHHFMSYGICPSAVTLAGFILGATTDIHVGTAVSVLSTQHPVALAEQAALLTLASHGRFRLVVGRGGPWRDLEVFGTGLDRYETGFPEALDLLLNSLEQPHIQGMGPTFSFREVPFVPDAAVPPVAVACTSPATEAIAAARNLPMLLGMHIGDEEKAAAIARYDRFRADFQDEDAHRVTSSTTGLQPLPDTFTGHVGAAPPRQPRIGPGEGVAPATEAASGTASLPIHQDRFSFLDSKASVPRGQAVTPAQNAGDAPSSRDTHVTPGHMATSLAFVADSRRQARRILHEELPRWLGPGLAGYVPVDDRPHAQRDPHEYARLLTSIHAVGSPEDCVSRLATTIKTTGIRHLILLVDCTGRQEAVLENIARLGSEVLPKLYTKRGRTLCI